MLENPFFKIFFSPFDIRRALPDIWDGFGTNVKLMLYAEVLILIFALVLAVIRGLPARRAAPLRWLVIGYCDFFRGTPLVLIAFVTRSACRRWLRTPSSGIAHWIGSQSLLVYGIMALTIVYSAYVAEVYRAGIESVHPSSAHGGALARPRLRADDALRDPAAGDPARDPAAPERLHRAAEGHRDHRRRRRHRGRAAGADLLDDVRELQRLHGGGGAVRVHHDPAGALHRRPDQSPRAARDGRRRDRSGIRRRSRT